MPVPDPITHSLDGRTPLGITYFLNRTKFEENSEKQIAKVEILKYLMEIDFPTKGVYHKK